MLFKMFGYEIFLTRNKVICDDKLPLLYYQKCDNIMYVGILGLRLTIET